MLGQSSKKFTEEQIDELVRRYRKGETHKELAAAFGCSTAPIRNALKMRGVRSISRAQRALLQENA